MRKFNVLFISFIFLLISCSGDDDNSKDELLNAVVLGTGVDCRDKFLIKLTENSTRLPSTFDNTFYAVNLPNEFKVKGKDIQVHIRELKKSEYFACTLLGPGYGAVYILSATDQ
ncbi:hypothetical protein [Flavimarina sp. Hel_I_48]|uniref:hypothetical protein n=1 Tax=Flavimarina sp. Hel_I_48 TaxID=1392488 RepID=UPI0004DF0A34|nr:hypothetical protein [Flavimarina sp. Hel_I_48]